MTRNDLWGQRRAERALKVLRPPGAASLKECLAFCRQLFCGSRQHRSAWTGGAGQEKKTVQKVQAPAQPFIAFDAARLADDQFARPAHPMFSCPLP